MSFEGLAKMLEPGPDGPPMMKTARDAVRCAQFSTAISLKRIADALEKAEFKQNLTAEVAKWRGLVKAMVDAGDALQWHDALTKAQEELKRG